MEWNWKIMLVALLIFLSLAGNIALFTKNNELNKIIADYKDIEELNNRSEAFAKAYVSGDYSEYLTNDASKRTAQALEAAGHDNHAHDQEASGLADVVVDQLFTKRIPNQTNQAESYASTKLRYEMGISDTYADDYFQDVSLKSKWIKENDIWKVDEVSVSVLDDSNDNQLREQAQRALENAAGTSGGDTD